MLILHNPETKETLVQTAQVSRVSVCRGGGGRWGRKVEGFNGGTVGGWV